MNNDLLIALNTAIAITPQIRLGQLISNAARAGGWENNDVFYCPNEVILNGLNKIAATERDLKS